MDALPQQLQTKTLVLPCHHTKDYANDQWKDKWHPLGTNGSMNGSGTQTSQWSLHSGLSAIPEVTTGLIGYSWFGNNLTIHHSWFWKDTMQITRKRCSTHIPNEEEGSSLRNRKTNGKPSDDQTLYSANYEECKKTAHQMSAKDPICQGLERMARENVPIHLTSIH